MYFNSRRSTVLATNGMVATSQPLGAMAGLQMVIEGGNAVDAAVATAAALNVVEPVSTISTVMQIIPSSGVVIVAETAIAPKSRIPGIDS